MEPFALQSEINGVGAQPLGQQLRAGYDPVLTLGESRDCRVITKLTFAVYMAVKVNFVAHGAQHGAARRTGLLRALRVCAVSLPDQLQAGECQEVVHFVDLVA